MWPSVSGAASFIAGNPVNLLRVDVHAGWAILGIVLLVPALLWALRSVWGRFLAHDVTEHVWLGGALCVALLWMFEVRVGNGPGFGMLGCALYVLLFGRARGMLGLMIAVLLHTALHHGAWLNLGLNGVLFAVVPAILTSWLQTRIERALPHNVFVFIIGNGVFATLVATAMTSLALIAAALYSGAVPPVSDLSDYVDAAMLLAWGEALVSGMLFSALVIYVPAVVLTFRRDEYLPVRAGSR